MAATELYALNSQLRASSLLNYFLELRADSSLRELFINYLDLLVEHLAAEAVNRYACFAEALAKAGAPTRSKLSPS